ncbi:MAG TPA: MATE family efflux transporter [Cytophagales bacterium]|nr:MATE family efflux transporter [Cytophagales bacterium]
MPHLGEEPINSLLVKMSVPAAIGMLVMTVYQIVDTFFVGQWIGANAIAGVSVVLPLNMLISSVGMGLGVGGASIISRALGANDRQKAERTLGNMINLNLHFTAVAIVIGYIFTKEVLHFFGGRGDIYPYAYDYFTVLLPSLPLLSWAIMANNVIRAEGNPRRAMYVMIVPAVANVILDPVFIIWLDMGIKGAAWATVLAYAMSALYALDYFIKGKSALKLSLVNFKLKWTIVQEMLSIGMTSFARQGSASLLAIIVNRTLFGFGGEISVAVYGVISRLLMFLLFPVLGLGQGFLPIAGFNYGARRYDRVLQAIKGSVLSGFAICLAVWALVMGFPEPLIRFFTDDKQLIVQSIPAMRTVFLLLPIIAVQLICTVYFQALGKALPSLLLTLLRQGLISIPLILILPHFMGINGVWWSFPISDLLATAITLAYTWPRWQRLDTVERMTGAMAE